MKPSDMAAGPTASETRIFISGLGARSQWLAIAVVGAVLACLWIAEAYTQQRWDWMLISGWLLLLVGLGLAQRAPAKLELTLARLVDRGVLVMSAEPLQRFQQDLEQQVQTWAWRGGLTVALVMGLAFSVILYQQGLTKLMLAVAEISGGYLAGCYLGRLTCYGRLGPALGTHGGTLQLKPCHWDGVGGLQPIGDFYFYQAGVAALPALFLAGWLLLLPLPAFQAQYMTWQAIYFGLLPVALGFELLAFFLPLWWFHQQMVIAKSHLLQEADRLSGVMADQYYRGLADPTGEMPPVLPHRDDVITYCRTLEQLPVWPISATLKRRLSLNNALLLLPWVSKALGLSQHWADVVTAVTAAFQK